MRDTVPDAANSEVLAHPVAGVQRSSGDGTLRRQLLQGAALVLLCLLLIGGLARHLVDRQLLQGGAEEAEHWMDFARTALPGLDELLRRGQLAPDEAERLRLLAGADEVLHLRLHLPDGRFLLQAGEVDLLASEPALRSLARDALRRTWEQAQPQVLIHHGAGDQQLHAAVVMVPVLQEDQVLAVTELHIDQSERAESLELAFLLMCLTVAGLAVLAASLVLWRTVRGFRRRLHTESHVRYLAAHDALSGALNRASLMQLLAESARTARADGPRYAVLCLDLDHFKDVNDQHGHAAGDEVLRVVTQRLRAMLRSGDAVARLGGDEFAVVQHQLGASEDALRLGERVVAQLGQPVRFGGKTLRCGASVGVALWQPGLEGTEDLLKRADAALYQAKSEGRGVACLYDADLDATVRRRRALAQDLRQAESLGHLSLHYQALFDSRSGELCGFEALMRWRHPELGDISPSEFIPLAEEYGLIESLGDWALRSACHCAAAWLSPVRVAVNLSAAQFSSGRLPRQVADALQASGLAAARLQLEVTESLLVGDAAHTQEQLAALKALGVELALDDFGTGYSSLSYLWRFPFDTVKIDRSFVAGLTGPQPERARLMISSIIDMAHALALRVTAEGVEVDAQQALLQDLGCDTLQGFGLARPVPLEALRWPYPARAVRPIA